MSNSDGPGTRTQIGRLRDGARRVELRRPHTHGVEQDRRSVLMRDRRGETLFIDARKLGRMVDRTHRELGDDEIARISGMYHLWRGEKSVRPETCMMDV